MKTNLIGQHKGQVRANKDYLFWPEHSWLRSQASNQTKEQQGQAGQPGRRGEGNETKETGTCLLQACFETESSTHLLIFPRVLNKLTSLQLANSAAAVHIITSWQDLKGSFKGEGYDIIKGGGVWKEVRVKAKKWRRGQAGQSALPR